MKKTTVQFEDSNVIPATLWEECSEADEAYLNDWLRVWGCG